MMTRSRGWMLFAALTTAVLLTGCGRLRPDREGSDDNAAAPTFTAVAPPVTAAPAQPTTVVEPSATAAASATALPQPTATAAPTETTPPTATIPVSDTSGDALDTFLGGLGNPADDPTIVTELQQIP